jgi:uncharacterized lipoprotein YbaY
MSFNIGIGTRLLARSALVSFLGLIASPGMAQSIQGTAAYRERMALPSAAVLEVALEDVSRVDAPAETIARTRVVSPGNPPIAFTIAYDPARILPDHRYVVRARILLDDKLLFTTDTATPVINRGSPTNVSLMLRRVGAGQTAPAKAAGTRALEEISSPGLAGTSWQLVKFQGGDGTTLTPDDGAKYTIEFGDGGVLTARIDCNRGRGTWKSSGSNQLQLGPLILTRAKCPAGSMHDHIVKQWSYIRSYVVKDGHLFLALMADGGIYEFEPVKKPKP